MLLLTTILIILNNWVMIYCFTLLYFIINCPFNNNAKGIESKAATGLLILNGFHLSFHLIM